MKNFNNSAQKWYTGQQWLTAMQHHLNRVQVVLDRMFCNPLRRPQQDFIRDDLRAAPPALVSCLIHVAVITSQITPAMYLEDKLIQRNQGRVHASPFSKMADWNRDAATGTSIMIRRTVASISSLSAGVSARDTA
jgi:hypothetical protein